VEETNSSNIDNDAEEVQTPQTLEERIAYLETQNEGLKRVGGLALVLLILLGVLFVHQVHSDLKATTSQGFTLLDERKLPSVGIVTSRPGAFQILQGNNGILGLPRPDLPEGFQGFGVYDSQGRPRLLSGEKPDGSSVFLVVDPVRQTVFNPFEELDKAQAKKEQPKTKDEKTPKPSANPK